jgi:uridine kinase
MGDNILSPIYNMVTSKRETNEFKEIKSCDIIILEGIYALYDKVRF